MLLLTMTKKLTIKIVSIVAAATLILGTIVGVTSKSSNKSGDKSNYASSGKNTNISQTQKNAGTQNPASTTGGNNSKSTEVPSKDSNPIPDNKSSLITSIPTIDDNNSKLTRELGSISSISISPETIYANNSFMDIDTKLPTERFEDLQQSQANNALLAKTEENTEEEGKTLMKDLVNKVAQNANAENLKMSIKNNNDYISKLDSYKTLLSEMSSNNNYNSKEIENTINRLKEEIDVNNKNIDVYIKELQYSDQSNEDKIAKAKASKVETDNAINEAIKAANIAKLQRKINDNLDYYELCIQNLNAQPLCFHSEPVLLALDLVRFADDINDFKQKTAKINNEIDVYIKELQNLDQSVEDAIKAKDKKVAWAENAVNVANEVLSKYYMSIVNESSHEQPFLDRDEINAFQEKIQQLNPEIIKLNSTPINTPNEQSGFDSKTVDIKELQQNTEELIEYYSEKLDNAPFFMLFAYESFANDKSSLTLTKHLIDTVKNEIAEINNQLDENIKRLDELGQDTNDFKNKQNTFSNTAEECFKAVECTFNTVPHKTTDNVSYDTVNGQIECLQNTIATLQKSLESSQDNNEKEVLNNVILYWNNKLEQLKLHAAEQQPSDNNGSSTSNPSSDSNDEASSTKAPEPTIVAFNISEHQSSDNNDSSKA